MAWPATLPQTPLIGGYTEVDQEARIRSDVDAGASKQRNRFTAIKTFTKENYLLTKAQRDTFLSFYRDTLGNGADSFIKQDPVDEVNKIYRIAEYSISLVWPLYRLELELEILPQ